MSEQIEFGDALEDTDFGLIVCGKTGRLKGIWMPEGVDEDSIPDSIVQLCVDYFDIDPDEFDSDGDTDTPRILH